MKREDVPSSGVLGSIGLAAAGVVVGVVARAVVLGGKVVATGLETLEHVLRSAVEEPRPSPETNVRIREEHPASDAEAAPWADGVDALPSEAAFEAPFEPADGLTGPARPSSAVPRRSSAGAARTTPPPRPTRRATARSVPPPLRSVRNARTEDRAEPSVPPTPAKGAADAAEETPAARGTAATRGTPAKRATATRSTTKAAAAKKVAAKKTAAKNTAAKNTAAKKTAAKKTSAGTRTAAKKSTSTEPGTGETAAPSPAETAAPSPAESAAPSPGNGSSEGTSAS